MLSGTKGALLPSALKHLVSCPHRALSGSARNKVERGLGQQAPTCRSKITELCISSSKKCLDLHRGCTTSHRALVWSKWKMMRAKKKFCISRNFSHLCLKNCSPVSKLFPPNNQSVLKTAALKMGFSQGVWERRAVRDWPHFQHTSPLSLAGLSGAFCIIYYLLIIYITAISLAFLKIIIRV